MLLLRVLRKKILVENVEDIFPKLKDVFEISLNGHFLYLFDKDCKDWVTVEKPDDIAQLCGKGELLIKEKDAACSERSHSEKSFCSSSSAPVNVQCTIDEACDNTQLNFGHLDDLFDVKTCLINDKEPKKDWPSFYILPKFSPLLDFDIKSLPKTSDGYGIILSSLRRRIVQFFFEELRSYIWYPSSYQYRDVLNSALRKYPVLRDRMAHQEIYYHSWLESLRQKFKRARPSVSSSLREEMVKNMPQTVPKERKEKPVCKTLRLQAWQDFYLSESEDEFSIQKHIEIMKKEVKKPVPRRITTLICDRMKRTRSICQKEVKQLVPVKELLEKYAPLGEGNGIIQEMDTMWKIDCLKLIQDKKFLFLMQQAKQKLPEFV